MALTDLLRAIGDDADAERAEADREAAAEAASIVEQARREADALEATLATASEAQARVEAERDLARARLTAAATVRAAREEAFGSLLAEIRTELARMRGSDAYPALLRALVAESRAALPGARELHVDPRDLDLALSIPGDLRVVTTLDTCGGVDLVGEDGRTVRNTLEQRLANAEPLLRGLFTRRLADESVDVR